MKFYFTVIIPYTLPAHATAWHPTTDVGPFSTLSRGCFATKKEAKAWADAHLNHQPYKLKRFEGV